MWGDMAIHKVSRFLCILALLLFISSCGAGSSSSGGSSDQSGSSDHKAWTNPSSLKDHISHDGQPALEAQVAMDDNGNAIIVWEQFDGFAMQIFKSEYRGGVWHNPSSITNSIPGWQDAYEPQVAMDKKGNAIITWYENWQIFKSEYRDGVWHNPSSLEDKISPDGQSAYGPRVAMDGSGNAIITWVQDDGSNRQIYKSEYRGGVWTNPASIMDRISLNGYEASSPQVAMDDMGNAIITWFQYDATDRQIFKSEYRDGVWTNPSTFSDHISPDGQWADDPQVAMDSSGNAIITWDQFNGIYKSEYRGGVWTNPALTDQINPDEYPASNPQVAMSDNGTAIITWEGSDGSNSQNIQE